MARNSRGKEARKERALERLEVSSQRTPEEQLSRLDQMFGEGQGAAKERAKLARRIEDRNRTATQVKKEEPSTEEAQPEVQLEVSQDTETQYRKKGKKA